MNILPVSIIIPTLNRHKQLLKMLESLAAQSMQPLEAVVVDASDDDCTRELCESHQIEQLKTAIRWFKAEERGAAAQRNQGIEEASQPYILFSDDDVVYEADCIPLLWKALRSDDGLGGVSSMIVNQRYNPPGLLTRTLFRLLNGKKEPTYPGKCIGPALNILPQDEPNLDEVVSVEWLNTTCTLYRREALPTPAFESHFVGYSLLEDLALSLRVARDWKLANARTARIFHDSQPAEYKDPVSAARMELINRHHVMVNILRRSSVSDYAKLLLLELFQVLTPLTSVRAWQFLPGVLAGKLGALPALVSLHDAPAVEPARVKESNV